MRSVLEDLHPRVAAHDRPRLNRIWEPVARTFAILAGYRERIVKTDCKYGCPWVGWRSKWIREPSGGTNCRGDFRGSIAAIRECVRLILGKTRPQPTAEALATYVLAVMEGAVMLSRSLPRCLGTVASGWGRVAWNTFASCSRRLRSRSKKLAP